MDDYTEMKQDGGYKQWLKSFEGKSQEEMNHIFRPFDDGTTSSEDTELEHLALNKYEKIYEIARKRTPDISWLDTVVVSLAADLEEYTGVTVRIAENYELWKVAALEIGEHTWILTAKRNGDGQLKMYFQKYEPETAWAIYGDKAKRLPATLDEIARVLVPGTAYGERYPYTRKDLEELIRGVVDYEAEEPDGYGRINLMDMGFSEDDMEFFGMPPYLEEDEELES